MNLENPIIIYKVNEKTEIEVKITDDEIWLSQDQIVELYQTSKSNISEHIKHIFEEKELNESSTVRKFRITASDNKSYNVKHYNLEQLSTKKANMRNLKSVF